MSPCDEIRKAATALAALPASDPERVAAEAHAKACPGCASALQQASLIVGALDEMELAAPSAGALARTHAAIAVRMEEEARTLSWQRTILVPAQIVGLFAILALRGRGLPPEPWMQGGFLAAVAAALALLIARKPGFVTAASLVLAAAAGAALGGAGELHARHGVACALQELVAASIPLATVAALLARGPARGAVLPAAAAVSALGGQAALVLICPYRTWGHLLVFHAGAVLLAAAIGAAWSLALERQAAATVR